MFEDNVASGEAEQPAHIGVENRIFHQMINHIQGHSQIELAEVPWKSIGQIKMFGCVVQE